ncbi:hypothetical protein HZA57_06585 [Candidatus Poribacteria bacterium]|nr:hypothetical protein [Candidatus Poribacteria bacterium]
MTPQTKSPCLLVREMLEAPLHDSTPNRHARHDHEVRALMDELWQLPAWKGDPRPCRVEYDKFHAGLSLRPRRKTRKPR